MVQSAHAVVDRSDCPVVLERFAGVVNRSADGGAADAERPDRHHHECGAGPLAAAGDEVELGITQGDAAGLAAQCFQVSAQGYLIHVNLGRSGRQGQDLGRLRCVVGLLQLSQQRGVKPADLLVSDIMVKANDIDIVYFRDVVYARVADILDSMKVQGRQHVLVEDIDPASGEARVRGVFSATQIGRLLGVPVQGFEVARTFAEIEAALAD